jgi:hypothetical protein
MDNIILLKKIENFINDNWYYDDENNFYKEINVDILLDFIKELKKEV